MVLNGIDISNYQARLQPARMAGTDFVIVLATQGTWFTQPYFRSQADGTLKAHKLLGLYHYIEGTGAVAEANKFVSNIRPYIGRALLAIDWESADNRSWGNLAYLRQLAQTVIRLTGVHPLIYCPASAYSQVRGIASALNCGLWIAQYATQDQTQGFQRHPWNEGAYSCACRQYADNGVVPGYGAGIDLDIFYGSRFAWNAYARTSKREKAEVITEQDKKDIAEHVWNFIQNGIKARDRLQGIDNAANNASRKANDLARTLLRTDAAGSTARPKTDMYTRIAWTGAYQHDQNTTLSDIEKKLDNISTRLDTLEGKSTTPTQGSTVSEAAAKPAEPKAQNA